jgi:predicted TPR repeat methyltransferase
LRASPEPGHVLDLGCGTGLMAVALSDIPLGPITGVDISGAMLEQAAQKQLYADLRRGDLVAILQEAASAWKIILAADVFCYTGDLAPALHAAYAALQPDGVFIFSVEACVAPQPGETWRLGAQGRYSHTADYVQSAARQAGFTISDFQRDDVRQEAGAPVAGFIVVLQGSAAHG